MREITEVIKIYTYEEMNDKQREKVKDVCFYDGWQFEIEFGEMIDSLRAMAKHLDLKLDYSLSMVSASGEFIKLDGKVDKLKLKKLYDEKGECSLTGVCYDYEVIDFLYNDDINRYINWIHDQYEYSLSDENLIELCQANEYEFLENGEMYI